MYGDSMGWGMYLLQSWGLIIFLICLGVILLMRALIIVPNRSAYVVERLGKFRGVLHAGFHVLIPFFDRVAYKRSLKEQVLDVPKQTCITRDNVSVDIDGVLYLQIITPEKSAYGISDYEWGAIQLAQTALRSAIGKLELDKTFEERTRINQEVVEALDAATSPWGVKVLRYEIRDITPPSSVMQAMEKQMRAEREKRAVIAQSEGEKQSQINLAEGSKAAAIAESEGRKQAAHNVERGEDPLRADVQQRGHEVCAEEVDDEHHREAQDEAEDERVDRCAAPDGVHVALVGVLVGPVDEHGVAGAADVVDQHAEDAERHRDGDGHLGGAAGLNGDGHGDERGEDAVGRDVAARGDHAEIDHLDAAAGDDARLEVAGEGAEHGANEQRRLHGLDERIARKAGRPPEPQAANDGEEQVETHDVPPLLDYDSYFFRASS